MTRREFTRKTKAAALERAAGHCEKCGAKLKPREAEIDHILPCELGGEATLANAQVLCRVCHREKTGQEDVPRIRKSDRQRDKASGAIKPKGRIKSKPFEKKTKPAKLPIPPRRAIYEEVK